MRYCIYALIHPEKFYPIYVGCTQDLQRRYTEHRRACFQYPEWSKEEPKSPPLIKVLALTHKFEKARKLEMDFIKLYRDTIFNNPNHKVHYNHKPIKTQSVCVHRFVELSTSHRPRIQICEKCRITKSVV